MIIDFSDVEAMLAYGVWLIKGGWWWRKLAPEEIAMFADEPGFPSSMDDIIERPW